MSRTGRPSLVLWRRAEDLEVLRWTGMMKALVWPSLEAEST